MMKKDENRREVLSDRAQQQQHRRGSERGVALVLVLVLSTIGLLVMTTVLYVIIMGTQISSSEKRYRTAHEAALGGVDVMKKIIADQSGTTVIPGVTLDIRPSFLTKLNAPSLTGYNTQVSIDPSDSTTYDVTMDIGNPVYRVYAKMTQKNMGNTNKGYKPVRIKTGVVPADPGMGVVHLTYYTFTILTQKVTNNNERIRIDLVNIF